MIFLSLSNTSFLFDLFDNSVLAWSLVACGLAQLSKLIFEYLNNQKWRPAVLFETGGMPSSHSALVTGAASGIGVDAGFDSALFALSVTIAFIVMYDASGIRRSAGLIAAQINELPRDNWPSPSTPLLKENLGHSKLQVLIGGLLGPVIVIPGMSFLGSPLHLVEFFGFITG